MTSTEEVLSLAEELLVEWAWEAEGVRPESNRLDVMVASAEDLVAMVTALRVKRLGYLAAITGVDPGPETGELEVLYHFCAAAAVITLRVRLSREKAVVDTLSDIIPSAEPFERELSEMFGITIKGLRAPKHIYLPDEWPEGAYPLRKDFDREVLSSQG